MRCWGVLCRQSDARDDPNTIRVLKEKATSANAETWTQKSTRLRVAKQRQCRHRTELLCRALFKKRNNEELGRWLNKVSLTWMISVGD